MKKEKKARQPSAMRESESDNIVMGRKTYASKQLGDQRTTGKQGEDNESMNQRIIDYDTIHKHKHDGKCKAESGSV